MQDYKNYACPGQTLTLRKPKETQQAFDFNNLKEPGSRPEQKEMEDQTARRVDLSPQAENLPAIPQTALTRFDMQAAVLAEIKKYQLLIVDITDKKTFNVAKKAKSVVRDLRLKIQRREKELNADLNKKKADLKKDATFLKTDIKETEDHLIIEMKKWTDEQARIEKIEEEKEAARKKTIDHNFDLLVQVCNKGLTPGLSTADIANALAVLDQTTTSQEVFQERYQDACSHLNYSIENTRRAYLEAVEYENRQAEMARIEKEGQRVEQVAWFNDNFGVMADLATMEASLEHLENMYKANHLAELIKDQAEKARAIITRTRATMPEPVEETPVIDTTTSPQVKNPTPKNVKIIRSTEPREIELTCTFEGRKKATSAPENSEDASNAQLIENFRTIESIIQNAAPGGLYLVLSSGLASTPIILSPEDLNTVLVLIEAKFKQAVTGKA